MPIEFFRFVVEVIGVACCWMAARNLVLIRKGKQDPRRIYGWFARAMLCVVAAALRHPLGPADFIFWALCVLAYLGGWRQASNAKPAEDLTDQIFPGQS